MLSKASSKSFFNWSTALPAHHNQPPQPTFTISFVIACIASFSLAFNEFIWAAQPTLFISLSHQISKPTHLIFHIFLIVSVIAISFCAAINASFQVLIACCLVASNSALVCDWFIFALFKTSKATFASTTLSVIAFVCCSNV
jgi:hypothetical protein